MSQRKSVHSGLDVLRTFSVLIFGAYKIPFCFGCSLLFPFRASIALEVKLISCSLIDCYSALEIRAKHFFLQIWLFSRFSTGWICGLHADFTELYVSGCVDNALDRKEGAVRVVFCVPKSLKFSSVLLPSTFLDEKYVKIS